MGANNSQLVTVGKPKVGGSIYRAPIGTALPTDAVTPLGSAYTNMGYVSEDGVTNSNSPESDELKAWGGDTVLTYQTAKPDTFKYKLIEALNPEVLKYVYGDDNVSGTLLTGVTITANSKDQEENVIVIDMILRNNVLKRMVIPRGKVSEVSDVVYKDGEAVGYETTLVATPDNTGNTHYEYLIESDVTTYTVTFDSDEGSSVAAQTVKAGEAAVQPANPTKEGYVFNGWYADEELTELYVFGTEVTEDITLYAKWVSA